MHSPRRRKRSQWGADVSRSERRREARGGGSGMNKLWIILGVVAVAGVGAVGYSVSSGGGVTEPIVVEGVDDMESLIALAQGVTKGDPNAPIQIVEFGDYQCPACGAFANLEKPRVESTYVESGKAQFVFYDFPLTEIHPNAFLAARAARCAEDQEMYWEYHDNLFLNQTGWSSISNPQAPTDPTSTFVEYAETLGLDEGDFESCLRSDRHADVVSANMQLGRELGVSSTPTILINGEGSFRGVSPTFESIQSVIDGILEPGGGGGGP